MSSLAVQTTDFSFFEALTKISRPFCPFFDFSALFTY